jgi:hypothetical protein
LKNYKHLFSDTKIKSETSSPVKTIPSTTPSTAPATAELNKIDPVIEKKVMLVLCDIGLDIPCSSSVIADQSSKALKQNIKLNVIEELLKKLASQKLIK